MIFLKRMRRMPVDVAIVASVAALLFLPTLGYGLLWDDLGLLGSVRRTVTMSGLGSLFTTPFSIEVGVPSAFYRPVPCFSLALDDWLGGGRPSFFHATNVALHVLSSVLVWCLARRFVSSRSGALLGALLFAVHPVHVESVAWISGRTDLLASFFTLLATLAWCAGKSEEERTRRLATAAGVACYVLACMAKEIALVLPFVLVAWDLFQRQVDFRAWLRGNRMWLISWSAALAACMALRISVVGPPIGEGGPERLKSVLNVSLEYMRLLVAPWPLNAFYTHAGVRLRLANVGSGVLFLALASLPLLRRPTRRRAATACTWLVAFLAPALGFVSFRGALVAERFLYLPSVGVALLVAAAFDGPMSDRLRRLMLAGVALAIVAFAALSWIRIPVWSTGVSLYRDMLEKSPDYLPAHENLGVALEQAGRSEEAIAVLEAAVRMQPRYAGFHRGLGLLHAARGQAKAAAREFELALELEPENGLYWYYLGGALQSQGRASAAERAYLEATRLNPFQLKAWTKLGKVYLELERYLDAAAAFEGALRLAPDDADALFGGALAYARSGEGEKSKALSAALRRLDPSLADQLRRTPGMTNERE